MSGLDVAAGVAGLITLADVVINRTYKTIKLCKNAGEDSQRLLEEVQSLLGILNGLRCLADEVSKGALKSYIPADEVLNCQRTLTKVRDKLVKANPDTSGISTAQKWKRTLIWPISSEETTNILSELERYKNTFDLSISIDILENILAASEEQAKVARGVEDVRNALQNITRIQLNEERHRTLEFFGTFDAEVSHGTNTQLRQLGTGLWLTQGPELQNWLQTRNSKLWMYGIPGAGKTVLAAAAVEETIPYAKPEYAVAYYYCDYKNPASQQLERIISCLAGQLARQSEVCFSDLAKLYRPAPEQLPRHSAISLDELVRLLKKLVSKFDEVAIIVDGVDECVDPGAVALALSELVSQSATVRLLIASRDEQIIRQQLGDFKQLSIAAWSEDLKLYVSSEIQERSRKGVLTKNAALMDEIMEALITGAHGM